MHCCSGKKSLTTTSGMMATAYSKLFLNIVRLEHRNTMDSSACHDGHHGHACLTLVVVPWAAFEPT
jgi:hypothetical protein